MRWLWRKLLLFCGTVVALAGGLTAAQFLAFLQQYRQRLGGHIDEAARTLEAVRAGELARSVGDAARDQFVRDLVGRLAELRQSLAALDDAGPFAAPLAFLQHADWTIAEATLGDFRPQIPLDAASLVYGGVGILIVWIVYDLVTAPLQPASPRRGRRTIPAEDS